MLLRQKIKLAFTIVSVLLSAQVYGQKYSKEVEEIVFEASEHYRMAQEIGHRAEFDKALKLYLKADSLQPNHPEISYSIGVCYSITDHKMLALPYLEKAKKGGVSYYDVDFYLASAYHLAHRFQEAITL